MRAPALLLAAGPTDGLGVTRVTYDAPVFTLRARDDERLVEPALVVDTLLSPAAQAAGLDAQVLALGENDGVHSELFTFTARRGRWIDVSQGSQPRACEWPDVRVELVAALTTLVSASPVGERTAQEA